MIALEVVVIIIINLPTAMTRLLSGSQSIKITDTGNKKYALWNEVSVVACCPTITVAFNPR